jgi:FkbM family methyltransferase
MNFSQNKEQEIILDYFNGETGTFLDIGANDGKTLSNTHALALLGWSGHCVEPSPTAFERLVELYKDNKKIRCYDCAICEKDGFFTLFESGSHQSIGDTGLVSSLLKSETLKWSEYTSFKEVEVLCATWKTFARENEISQVEFISIDAEGMDLQILGQMELKKLGCGMLCVEYGLDENLRKEMTRIAHSFGLSLFYVSDQNLIFAL